MKNYLPFGDILKESARVFRLHFTKILILILLVMLPLSIVNGIVGEIMLRDSGLTAFMELMNDENATEEMIETGLADLIPGIMPSLLLMTLLSLLALTFPAALTRLTLDECRHGALTLNYMQGDLYVVVTDANEVHDVGSATDYFGASVKLMPKIIFCTLCGGLITMAGLSLMFFPGLIAFAVMSVSLYYTVLTGRTGFKGFLETGILLLKRPFILLVFIVGNGAALFTNFMINNLFLLIPLPEATAGTVLSVALTAASTCIASVVTAFTAIITTCLTVESLDKRGFKANEKGFLTAGSEQ
ncbi:MAG: hypothetical protein K6G89_04345 [Clostridia bacterium]|nr:hypothetical protein [Clostridia bacterium]